MNIFKHTTTTKLQTFVVVLDVVRGGGSWLWWFLQWWQYQCWCFLWGGTSSGAIGGDGGEGGYEGGGGFDVGSEMEKCTAMQPMVM